MKIVSIFLIVLIISLLSLTACDQAARVENVRSQNPVKVVDYGNGVFYFDYTEADFGNALSFFIEQHPELELVTMASDNNASYGHTCGYFVYFKK